MLFVVLLAISGCAGSEEREKTEVIERESVKVSKDNINLWIYFGCNTLEMEVRSKEREKDIEPFALDYYITFNNGEEHYLATVPFGLLVPGKQTSNSVSVEERFKKLGVEECRFDMFKSYRVEIAEE